jgi:hypothetical protein
VKLKYEKHLTYRGKPTNLRDFSYVSARHSKLNFAATCGELLLKVTMEYFVHFVANLECRNMKQGLSQIWTGFL